MHGFPLHELLPQPARHWLWLPSGSCAFNRAGSDRTCGARTSVFPRICILGSRNAAGSHGNRCPQACDSWGTLPQCGRSCSSPRDSPVLPGCAPQVPGSGRCPQPGEQRGLDVSCPRDWPTGTGASRVGSVILFTTGHPLPDGPASAPLGTQGPLGKGDTCLSRK